MFSWGRCVMSVLVDIIVFSWGCSMMSASVLGFIVLVVYWL